MALEEEEVCDEYKVRRIYRTPLREYMPDVTVLGRPKILRKNKGTSYRDSGALDDPGTVVDGARLETLEEKHVKPLRRFAKEIADALPSSVDHDDVYVHHIDIEVVMNVVRGGNASKWAEVAVDHTVGDSARELGRTRFTYARRSTRPSMSFLFRHTRNTLKGAISKSEIGLS